MCCVMEVPSRAEIPCARLQDVLPPKAYNAAKTLVLTVGVAIMSGILLLVIFYVISSPTFGWTGDLLPLLRAAHGLITCSDTEYHGRPKLSHTHGTPRPVRSSHLGTDVQPWGVPVTSTPGTRAPSET